MMKLSLSALLVIGLAPAVEAQTTVDGLIYASYRYGLAKDTSFGPDAAQNNFEVDRAYLTVRSKAAGGINTRVTIDVDSRKAAANQQTFRLKYAYADWTPEGSSISWRFGMQNTPVIGYVEDTWGYRMQGSVPLDRYKYTSSSDIGLAADGSWKSNGVTMLAGVFNGEGYSGTPGDQRKDVAARVSVRLRATDNDSKTGGLRVAGFTSIGRANGGAVRNRLGAVLSYQSKALTLGTEVYSTTDSTAADPETKGSILSAFSSYQRVGSPVGLIARADLWDPNTDLDPAAFAAASSRQTRLIAGVSYLLAKNVRLLLDADIVSADGTAVPNSFTAANRTLFLHTEIKF